MNSYHDSLVLKFDDFATGNAGSSRAVFVYKTDTDTLPSLYEVDGTTQKDNPFLTDENGNYSFKIEKGIYDIVSSTGVSKIAVEIGYDKPEQSKGFTFTATEDQVDFSLNTDDFGENPSVHYVYLNGRSLDGVAENPDYTITGNTITIDSPILEGDKITGVANYEPRVVLTTETPFKSASHVVKMKLSGNVYNDGDVIETQSYIYGLAKGGATYDVYSIAAYKTIVDDSEWEPDEVRNHTLGGQKCAIMRDKPTFENHGLYGDGQTDDSVNLKFLLENSSGLITSLPNSVYFFDSEEEVNTTAYLTLRMNNSTILFGKSKNSCGINFEHGLTVTDAIFDGGNNGLNSIGSRSGIIRVAGDNFYDRNVTYQNAVGLEDETQYGVIINQNTKSLSENCTYKNIQVATWANGAHGFCGGAFITTDQLNLGQTGVSSHTFIDCNGFDIYTTPNSSGVNFPDSDLIRNYTYEQEAQHGTTYAQTIEDVKRSSIIVKGGTCVNVLKSHVKCTTARLVVEGAAFYVDDARGQDQIYAAYRCQGGRSFTIRDSIVVGENISIGALGTCDEFLVENFHFSSTRTPANGNTGAAVFIGGVDSNRATVKGLYVKEAMSALNISKSTEVSIDGVYIEEDALKKSVITYLGQGGDLPSFVSCKNIYAGKQNGGLDSGGNSVIVPVLDRYNAYSIIPHIEFENLNYETGIIGTLFPSQYRAEVGQAQVESVTIRNSTIGGSSILFSGTYSGDLKIINTLLKNNSTYKAPLINVSCNSFYTKDFTIRDNRNVDGRNDILTVNSNDVTMISHNLNITTSGYGAPAYELTGTAGKLKVDGMVVDSIDTYGKIINATGYDSAHIDNVQLKLPNSNGGAIDLEGCAFGVVNGLSGDFKELDYIVPATEQFEHSISRRGSTEETTEEE